MRGTLSVRNEECGVLVVSRVRSGDRLHDASGIGCGAVRTGVGLGLWARVGLGLGLVRDRARLVVCVRGVVWGVHVLVHVLHASYV